MLEQLIPAFPEHEFHLLLDRSVDREQLGLDFPNTTFHVVRPPARHPLLWTLWNDYAVPLRLKKLQADLYWSPDGLPAKTDVKQWLTIHDLNFEHHPQWVPKPVAKYYRKHIRAGALLADHVFTVSQWSKSDLVNTYRLSEEKVSVTYNAPQEAMSVGEMDTTAPYFCAVGALTPRKTSSPCSKHSTLVQRVSRSKAQFENCRRGTFFRPQSSAGDYSPQTPRSNTMAWKAQRPSTRKTLRRGLCLLYAQRYGRVRHSYHRSHAMRHGRDRIEQ